MAINRKICTTLVIGVALVLTDFEMSGDLSSGVGFTLVPEAQARVGNPLTPVSYAGVARRTTRRVVRRSAIYVSALPGNCANIYINNAPYWQCGATYYQQSGTQYVVVYIDD